MIIGADLYDIPEQMESFISIVGEHIRGHEDNHVQGSIFEKQSNHANYSSGASNAFSQGSLLQINAANHGLALARSINEPVLAHAPWAISRNVIEASTLSSWLLSPSIEARERSARSYALRFKGSLEQQKFARSVKDTKTLDEAKSRTSEIEAKAVSDGHKRIWDRKGKLIGIGVRLPSSTELVELELGMGAEYRLFSAMLHGHHWATQQLSYRKIEAPSGIALEEHISPLGLVFMAQKSIESFYLCSNARFNTYGWNSELLNRKHVGVQQKFREFFESLDTN